MRWAQFSCLALAGLLTACGTLDERYLKQGIGTELYTAQLPDETRIQDLYLGYICHQAGLSTVPSGEVIPFCDDALLSPRHWALVVQAGMNDIDQRCDNYLAWVDNKRRWREPILKQLHTTAAAAAAIMGLTGVGAVPIAVVGTAFGFAQETFVNLESRLITEVDHSVLQVVVLDNQNQFRANLAQTVTDNRPAAIYLLRNYLRICMPFSIEMSINNSMAILHRAGPEALARTPPMLTRAPAVARIAAVQTALRQSIPSGSRAPLPSVAGQAGPKPENMIGDPQTEVEKNLPISVGRRIQGNLCVSNADGNFGADTREAIRQAKVAVNMSRADKAAPPLFRPVSNQIVTNDEAQIFLDARHCEVDRSGTDRAYATAFEKYRFADEVAIKDLQKALAKCDPNVKQTGIFDKPTRDGISAATGRRGSTVAKTDRLNDRSYEWVSGVCI